MMKKMIRRIVFFSLCCMAFAGSVNAAEYPVSLTEGSDGIKVELSKEAVDDEVHSLHLSFEIRVEQGKLSKDEISFDWTISDEVYKTQIIEVGDSGKYSLDIYASSKQDLFPKGDGSLTVGVVKLLPAAGSVTAEVALAGGLETVNGVQEKMELTKEDAVFPSVEIMMGNGNGSQKPADTEDKNSSAGEGSGAQIAENNNNAGNSGNTVRVVGNPDLNANSQPAGTGGSQNTGRRSPARRSTQKKPAAGEPDTEEQKTTEAEEHEMPPEDETASEKAQENAAGSSDMEKKPDEESGQDGQRMSMGGKILIGTILAVILVAGAIVAVKLSGKK